MVTSKRKPVKGSKNEAAGAAAEPTLAQLQGAGIVSSEPKAAARPAGSSPALRIACPLWGCKAPAGALCREVDEPRFVRRNVHKARRLAAGHPKESPGPATVDGKRVAYHAAAAAIGDRLNTLLWGVCICVENEPGYHPVPEYGPYVGRAGLLHAEGVARRLNERLELDEKTAALIVASTMKGITTRWRGRRG